MSKTENKRMRWNALPHPQQIEFRTGAWVPDFAVVVTGDAQLQHERERLECELRSLAETSARDRDSNTAPSRVVLCLDTSDAFGTEGFALEVAADVIVTAGTPAGVFRATRQIMQNLYAEGRVPAASVRSEPSVAERGLHIDAARKYYPAAWLKQLIIDAANVGVTTVQWHFSENEGVRLESLAHPEIVSAEHITRDEARQLIAIAQDLHIEIIPSLDMPGHLRRALECHPEFRLQEGDIDTTQALDIANPKAVAFALELIDDYAELFEASRYWNLGGDEFVDFDRMHDYPGLDDAAQERFGTSGTGFDLLTAFVNTVAAHVIDRGFIPRVWNDGMLRSRNVTLDTRVEFAWWTNWSASMRPVREAFSAGHRIVNVNDAMFYYVLGENAGYTYPTSERMWDADWHPGVFPMLHPSIVDRVQIVPRPYPKELLGASFAIWSDKPDAQTCAEVADGIRSPLRGFAERSWNGGSILDYVQFTEIDRALPATLT